VAEYEAETGKEAKDWLQDRFERLGISGPTADDGKTKSKAFRD
jgi:hypothetical protein